jgi:hypothetical protein
VVAAATVFGVPVKAPVLILKLIPGGVELIAKLEIAPPVEVVVNPVAAVSTVLLSVEEDNENAGFVAKLVILLTVLALEFAV